VDINCILKLLIPLRNKIIIIKGIKKRLLHVGSKFSPPQHRAEGHFIVIRKLKYFLNSGLKEDRKGLITGIKSKLPVQVLVLLHTN